MFCDVIKLNKWKNEYVIKWENSFQQIYMQNIYY